MTDAGMLDDEDANRARAGAPLSIVAHSVLVFRPVLLDDVGRGDRARDVGVELQRPRVVREVVDRQLELCERRRDRAQAGAHAFRDVRKRVRDGDGEAVGQEQRGPGDSDHAAADDGCFPVVGLIGVAAVGHEVSFVR
jgi:hypothetical protein